MSWNVGDEVSAAKINLENDIHNWTFSWTAPNNSNDDHTIGSQLFYFHPCGGPNDRIVIEWHAETIDEKYWFNWYNPWITMWIEKRDNAGNVIGSRYTIITAHHGDENITGNLKESDLVSNFGSSEGWYYLYYDCRDDKHGDATMYYTTYFYPRNCGSGRQLKYFIGPTSSGVLTGQEVSATNLNAHHFGTI